MRSAPKQHCSRGHLVRVLSGHTRPNKTVMARRERCKPLRRASLQSAAMVQPVYRHSTLSRSRRNKVGLNSD